MTASPQSRAIRERIITDPGTYYLDGEFAGQQEDIWYEYSEHHYPSFWLDADGLSASRAGNSD